MTDLMVVPQAEHWQRLKALVLDSVSSPITRRVYNLGLDEFFAWLSVQEPRLGFTKATVSAWRVALEARGLGAVSINVRITAGAQAGRQGCGQRPAGARAGRLRHACERRRFQKRPPGELALAPAGAGSPERAGHHHHEEPTRPRHHRRASGLRPAPVRSGGAYH